MFLYFIVPPTTMSNGGGEGKQDRTVGKEFRVDQHKPPSSLEKKKPEMENKEETIPRPFATPYRRVRLFHPNRDAITPPRPQQHNPVILDLDFGTSTTSGARTAPQPSHPASNDTHISVDDDGSANITGSASQTSQLASNHTSRNQSAIPNLVSVAEARQPVCSQTVAASTPTSNVAHANGTSTNANPPILTVDSLLALAKSFKVNDCVSVTWSNTSDAAPFQWCGRVTEKKKVTGHVVVDYGAHGTFTIPSEDNNVNFHHVTIVRTSFLQLPRVSEGIQPDESQFTSAIFFDGGARPNPGKAITDSERIAIHGKYLCLARPNVELEANFQRLALETD